MAGTLLEAEENGGNTLGTTLEIVLCNQLFISELRTITVCFLLAWRIRTLS